MENKQLLKAKNLDNPNRSVLRNLLVSMLAFGLFVGLIFPPFARIVLNTTKAYSPLFISLCVIAGLIVGIANFFLFKIVVSRELATIQGGMDHINENISVIEVMESNCLEVCTLDVTSADIIGDISQAFNNMAFEIFKRLELEGETRQLNADLMHSVELEDVAKTILNHFAGTLNAKAGLLYGGTIEKMNLHAHMGVDKIEAIQSILPEQFGPVEKAINLGEILQYSQNLGWEWFSQSTPLGNFKPGSIFLIPLIAKQKTAGLIILAGGKQKLKKTIRHVASAQIICCTVSG